MIAETKNDRIFLIINKAILITITILVAYPLYFVVIASISNYIAINNGNVIKISPESCESKPRTYWKL